MAQSPINKQMRVLCLLHKIHLSLCCFCRYHGKVLLHSPLSFQLFEELRIVPPAGKPMDFGKMGFGSILCGAWFMIVHVFDGWMMNVDECLVDSPTFVTFLLRNPTGEMMACSFCDCMTAYYETAKEYEEWYSRYWYWHSSICLHGRLWIIVCILGPVFQDNIRSISANSTHSQLEKSAPLSDLKPEHSTNCDIHLWLIHRINIFCLTTAQQKY